MSHCDSIKLETTIYTSKQTKSKDQYYNKLEKKNVNFPVHRKFPN